ncbi:hypothetical protein [Chitinimonas naiadis]
MTTKFIISLKKLKPTSKEAVKSSLANSRTHTRGVVAFKSDVVSLELPRSGTQIQIKKVRAG